MGNIVEVSTLLSEGQRSWAFLGNPFVFSDEVKKESPGEAGNEVQRSWAFLGNLFVFPEVPRCWAFLENLLVFLNAVLAAPAPALVANIAEVSSLLSEVPRSWAFLENPFVFSEVPLSRSAFCREGGRGPGLWCHLGPAAPRRTDGSESCGSWFWALSHGRAGLTAARRLRGFQHGGSPEAAALARDGQPALGSGQRGLSDAWRLSSLRGSAPEEAVLGQGRAGLTDARRPRGSPHGSAPTVGPRRIDGSESGGSPVKEIYEGFGESIHTAGVGAWLCLLIAILNFMQFGSSSVSPWPAPASGCVTAARRGALDYLEEQARHFVDLPGVAPDKVKKELPDETDNEVQRSWAFLEDLFVFSEVERSWAFLENLFVFLDAVLAAPAPALVANIPEVSPLLSEMQRSWAFLETLFVFSVAVLAAPAPRPRLLSCTRRTPARHPRGQDCRGLDAAVRGAALREPLRLLGRGEEGIARRGWERSAALLGLPGQPLRLLGGAALLGFPGEPPRLLERRVGSPSTSARGQHRRGLVAAVRGAALLGLPGEPLRLLGGAAQPFRFLPRRRAWPWTLVPSWTSCATPD